MSDQRQGQPKIPKNMDGGWEERETDEHGYRHFHAGRVEVRGFDGPNGYEPDGELVTNGPVRVHIERMDNGFWWLGLTWGNKQEVMVEFHSKSRIDVRWEDDRG